MSAYKRINKQDTYITTYTATKTWQVTGSALLDMGIAQYQAVGSMLSSLRHLYYPSKTGGVANSHFYDYYPQTTLDFPDSRILSTGSIVFSIPRELVGNNIEKGYGLNLEIVNPLYVLPGYWQDGYVYEISAGATAAVRDDGEGNLYLVGSSPRAYVGDIIYTHGIVVFTDATYVDFLLREGVDSLQWKSSHDIFTHTYHCRVRESEFNSTYNPTSLNSVETTVYDNEGSVYSTTKRVADGTLKNNITGSSFQPYITTVGLYNDANELIAVGKLAQPIAKSANTEMVITVKIDI